MLNIGAKTSAGSNFDSKSRSNSSLGAHGRTQNRTKKSSQQVPFPLVFVTDAAGSTFEPSNRLQSCNPLLSICLAPLTTSKLIYFHGIYITPQVFLIVLLQHTK